MASKNNKFSEFLDSPLMRIILLVASALLSTLVLALSTLTILEVFNKTYTEAPKYMVWIFLVTGVLSTVVFFRKRTKINLIRCIVVLAFDLVIGIVVIFAKNNPFLFSLTAGLYCLTIIVSRIFSLIQDHHIRNIVLNALIIILSLFFSLGLFLTPVDSEDAVQSVILLECVFIAIVSFVEAASIAFKQLKLKVLFKIIVNTYSLEVLFGLFTMIICFSLVFMMIEDMMPTFADALWYCFAVVTTIGFGDIYATTGLGRVLTVILGLYGLVVVAVITSIVVNFYNETSGKHDQKELKEIHKSEKKDE